ncbi:TetR/AcrR family transcriptional regulator [Steroidobacter cummioxidans]|uniref:TetR/AcrR family transcriptional regulator n=1 Tax=Steroidobacter cummioxidans TaxID=1803913 RepID=UPI000E31432F|nr:TetR/AcrR family transcriptional regulator [Steroidobacter cummioxidans]
MSPSAKPRAGNEGTAAPTESVRDRILNTARDLFYKEGARAVGVDTVVARSGVAKTSLYRWFPSKDALIVAVLEQEQKDRWAGWDRTAAQSDPEPRARLRAHLNGIARFVSSSHFRGCPFMNITVEFADPQHPARVLATEEMQELRRRLRGLVDNIEGVSSPEELTEQLLLLVDGAFSSAQALGKSGPQQFLVAAADALIDAQLKK